eukprot:CAMPEP_0198363952 /NCGR_PEP_ID=MMETSP1450-20131203/151594_1 /TAXON_ID=753684 ORGANISM="Madagascaria erythrocladiodes, Strain CCMP3234" /NCGR_SAMPLE_ID=MMETSP1450 /ASSEMBLY_ACC=CAM_ASM_001115 /LENGTH=43 /DNA_ID= /DNA_START= /DNA_END= /DNA_ORIENTATION=
MVNQQQEGRFRTPTIFLWTAPRTISTAFERSIMQLPTVLVKHE